MPGLPRHALVTQDVFINNTNDRHVALTFSGFFKGNLSAAARGAQAVAFQKAELFDASNKRLMVVDNQFDTDHNGQPLRGVHAADWTNVSITLPFGPPETEWIRFGTGLSQNGTQLAYTGYWDSLSAQVQFLAPISNVAHVTAVGIENDTDNNTSTAITYIATAFPTGDTDVLPDDWELQHFGSLDFDPTDDNDGDGFNNRAEYVAGTGPLDAHSLLRARIRRGTNIHLYRIDFDSATGRTYQLNFRTNASGTAWGLRLHRHRGRWRPSHDYRFQYRNPR